MVTREQVEEFLHEYLQVANFKDYCVNGLQVEGRKNIQKMATAVSANYETFEKAVQENVDALLVHHGLFWDKDRREITGSMAKKVRLLLENEISLFAYHLPLDAHPEVGNNFCAAVGIGLQNLRPFGVYLEKEIGVRGTLPPIAIDDFMTLVENYYGHPATVSKCHKQKIQTVAIISGGAWQGLKEAAKEGIDCFITGNFDEPAWSIAKEENIHFLALGHHATERIGPKALAKCLEEKFKIPCPFLDGENPF